LIRIGSSAFCSSSLRRLIIPKSVEIIGECCFSSCDSLVDIFFECGSRLTAIQSSAFADTALKSACLPPRLAFIASDAFPPNCALTSSTTEPSDRFILWNLQRRTRSPVPFKKHRPLSRLPVFLDLDSSLTATSPVSLKRFPILTDRKALTLFLSELIPLLALRHSCALSLAGIQPPSRSAGPALATAPPPPPSLAALLHPFPPAWWTPTAKAVVIVGVLLALVRAHSLGIAHGTLRPDCVFIDANHRPKVGGFGVPRDDSQLAGYCPPEPSRVAGAALKDDVFSFSLMIYAVAADDPKATAAKALEQFAREEWSGLPEFMVKLAVRGLSRDPGARPRAAEFLGQIEERNFAVIAGADAAAVAAFAARADDEEPDP
jgi:hypothetical protein